MYSRFSRAQFEKEAGTVKPKQGRKDPAAGSPRRRHLRIIRRTLVALLVTLLLSAAFVIIADAAVRKSTASRVVSSGEASAFEDADCILVLGCFVREDGLPSDLLKARTDLGIALYKSGAAPKLLMSGDHGRKDYNEVGTMKREAVEAGIPSSDVFMDHAGFSTYDSIYRARDVFGVRKMMIVSQGYHLYRALYIAEKLGIEAVGVAAEGDGWGGSTYRESREILARAKDFVKTIFKPKPVFLGEMIPISGDGNLTDD